jgi:hypothetical protein
MVLRVSRIKLARNVAGLDEVPASATAEPPD